MVVAEHNNLSSLKALVSNAVIHIELFDDREGNLFLSSPASDPDGVVYYATTAVLVYSFTENLITLQTLFNESPSLFVEIHNKDKATLYSRNDIEVELKCGDKKMFQLSDDELSEERCDTYSTAHTISQFQMAN